MGNELLLYMHMCKNEHVLVVARMIGNLKENAIGILGNSL